MNAIRIPASLLASCLIALGLARGRDSEKQITNSLGMEFR